MENSLLGTERLAHGLGTLVGVWDLVPLGNGVQVFMGEVEKLDVSQTGYNHHAASEHTHTALSLPASACDFPTLSAWLSLGAGQGGTLTCLVLPLARQQRGAASHQEPQGR